ncbi:hypothetical protein KC19_5G185200 [Ceratodon purpureus]|uniref:Uncharacterized protein n=1 Tax=Ceratodon purpureus TaxID=3225 RepID=A0A8T0I5Z7_CERPU|nr:hypothetical protein KC19_5G185200 [Ceratodon purpureus]
MVFAELERSSKLELSGRILEALQFATVLQKESIGEGDAEFVTALTCRASCSDGFRFSGDSFDHGNKLGFRRRYILTTKPRKFF